MSKPDSRRPLRSDRITQGAECAPHRSLLKATGVRDEDMDKPFIAVVIRYEGPAGGPGMQEMLSPTSAIMGMGLGESNGEPNASSRVKRLRRRRRSRERG